MTLLHLSISADDPKGVAGFLAQVMGGEVMPFPPFPDCWIAFAAENDVTAIEVYPTTHVLKAGSNRIACDVGERDATSTFVHAAIGSRVEAAEVLELATTNGWQSRVCNCGPFRCIEVWLENRLLVELLDGAMREDYREGMTTSKVGTNVRSVPGGLAPIPPSAAPDTDRRKARWG